MTNRASLEIDPALVAWRACQRTQDKLPRGLERDKVAARCEELAISHQLTLAALFEDTDGD